MTDEQIIKALECCGLMSIPCSQCPYFHTEPCVQLKLDALDLIKSQKAEIDGLTSKAHRYERYYFNHEYDKLEAEAIKDFAERLKDKQFYECLGEGWEGYLVYSDDIDNLVKEMIGEGNESIQQEDC